MEKKCVVGVMRWVAYKRRFRIRNSEEYIWSFLHLADHMWF